MKVRVLLTKTFSEASAAALDTAIAAFVQTIGEADLVSLSFSAAAGPLYAALLVYST